jgi:hypothetical protein
MIILAMCGVLLLVGGIQARAYVANTIVKYEGACGDLSGLPGVLKKVGLLQTNQHDHGSSPCATVLPHNRCASPGLVCSGTGPHAKTCTDLVAGCVCQ